MALLKILTAPDPRLKEKALPVVEVTAEIRQIMDDMLETMYDAPGVGLAATQVGILKRIIVIDVADEKNDEPPAPVKLANPELIETSKELHTFEEGCLSVPSYYEDVTRPSTCTVKGLDENNKEVIIKAEGLLATCLQHEIDHLDGMLFIDHISRLKRNVIIRKLKKDQKLDRERSHNHAL